VHARARPDETFAHFVNRMTTGPLTSAVFTIPIRRGP
jgi:hypothetical protein